MAFIQDELMVFSSELYGDCVSMGHIHFSQIVSYVAGMETKDGFTRCRVRSTFSEMDNLFNFFSL